MNAGYDPIHNDPIPNDALCYLITVKVDGTAFTTSRLPISGWRKTDVDCSTWERPGVYHFVERADGQIVSSIYGPRIFPSWDYDTGEEEFPRVERNDRKMTACTHPPMFASLDMAICWAVCDAQPAPPDYVPPTPCEWSNEPPF